MADNDEAAMIKFKDDITNYPATVKNFTIINTQPVNLNSRISLLVLFTIQLRILQMMEHHYTMLFMLPLP